MTNGDRVFIKPCLATSSDDTGTNHLFYKPRTSRSQRIVWLSWANNSYLCIEEAQCDSDARERLDVRRAAKGEGRRSLKGNCDISCSTRSLDLS